MTKRIRTMIPKTNRHGDLIRKTTTNKKAEGEDAAPTVRMYHHKVQKGGNKVTFVPMRSAPRPTVIRKPLFEVVDEDGNEYQMTKRQAKKAFSARQVRKALKRMSSDLKRKLDEERRRQREERVPEEGEADDRAEELKAKASDMITKDDDENMTFDIETSPEDDG